MKASAAARLQGVTPSTLARWSDSGILPEPVRVGPDHRPYYYEADIDALLHGGGLDELAGPVRRDWNV
jgi:DNA-binding transcriptional MerR regulator